MGGEAGCSLYLGLSGWNAANAHKVRAYSLMGSQFPIGNLSSIVGDALWVTADLAGHGDKERGSNAHLVVSDIGDETGVDQGLVQLGDHG